MSSRCQPTCYPIDVTSYLSELEEYKIIFRFIRSGILFFIDYNRIITKQQEQVKRGDGLDTSKRLQLIRVIEKIEKNPEFSEKLGIQDKSEFRSEKDPESN